MSDQWSFFLFHTPLNTTVGTGQITEMTEATSRGLAFSLTDGATMSFSLPGSHQDTPLYIPGKTDVLAFRGTRCMQRFLITEREITWSGGVSTCTYQAMSYRSLLDRWLIADGDTRDFTAVEQTAIAWTLISAAEARSNEQWNLTRGLLPDTDVPRTRVAAVDDTNASHGYAAGAKVGESVNALAAVDDGFEWDIEPDALNPNTALEFNVWNEGMRKQHAGATSDFVLDAGGTVANFSWKESMSEYGNVLRTQGKADTAANADGGTGPVAWDDLSAGTEYGRWERTLSVDDTTQAALDQRADAEVARLADPAPDWQITLRPNRWDPDALWLGDYARFVGTVPPLGDLDVAKRVHEINVSLTDEGAETVTLSIGRPSSDYFTRQLALERKIAALELR